MELFPRFAIAARFALLVFGFHNKIVKKLLYNVTIETWTEKIKAMSHQEEKTGSNAAFEVHRCLHDEHTLCISAPF